MTTPADSRYRAKFEKYMVAEADWKDARDLRNYKYSMDGVSVTMAIAAACGPQISVWIGQYFERNARMQPDELWKFLEETVHAVLLPAQERLRIEMRNTRQGADSSHDAYIACT